MENNFYLKCLSRLINEGLVKDNSEIFKFCHGKEIRENQIYRKEVNVNKVVVSFEINDGKKLLIEDLPINFLLMHTIIVGENSNLVEFEMEGSQYIAKKEVYDKVYKEKSEAKEFEVDELSMKKFKPSFDLVDIISELNKFMLQNKKLDLFTIHIVKGDTCEAFCPTLSFSHYKIAARIGIPLSHMIENNFIRDSNVNIYDYDTQIARLNPIVISEEKMSWEFDKETHNRIYRDILLENIIKVSDEWLEKRLSNVQVNDKDLFEKLSSLKEVSLSSQEGEILLPLWKSPVNQDFISLSSEEEFEEFSGVHFRLDEEYLKEITIMDTAGNNCIFRGLRLSKEVEACIESLEKEGEIKYESDRELLVKLALSDRKTAKKIERLDSKMVEEFYKHLEYLITLNSKSISEKNKIPERKEPTTLFEKYYCSVVFRLGELLNNYKAGEISKKDLLIEARKYLLKLRALNKDDENYFISQNCFELIEIFEVFDKKRASELYMLARGFFGDKDESLCNLDKDSEDIVEDMILANELEDVSIVKKVEFDDNLISKEVSRLKDVPVRKKYFDIDKRKIRRMFPNSYDKIINEVKGIKEKDIDKNIVKVGSRKVKLNRGYFKEYEEFENYETLRDNKYFALLRPRRN